MTKTNYFKFTDKKNFDLAVEGYRRSANEVQEMVRSTPGLNKEWRAIDECLSIRGKENCPLFYLDPFRIITVKCDPNDLVISVITNSND